MNASSWQAVWLLAVEVAAVVGLTWLITWRLRSVVWQRTLWQASLIALVGLLVVEFSAVSFPQREHEGAPVIQVATQDLPVQSIAPSIEIMGEFPADYQTSSQMTVIEAMPVETPKSISPLLLAIALGVWVVGSVVLAGRLLVGRFLLLRFCARSRMVTDEELRLKVQSMARKLGMDRSVQVLETAHIQTPVVFGLFRPTIALPTGFTEQFNCRQQEAILGHELAHLAARDPLWYLLADALVSALWWHPLVWVARARLQVASELAADEACVLAKHGPETLAECLVSIAQEMHGPGAMESIGIEGSGFRSRLGQRVERLLQLSAEMVTKPALWRMRLVKAGVPVLLLSLLVVGTGWMRKDGGAPWSEVVNGAWDTAVGAVSVEEEDIRRDPRPRLIAETKVEPRLAMNDEPPKSESLPAPNPYVRTNVSQTTTKSRQRLEAKLDIIVFKEVFFDGLPLSEVVRFLREESVRLDPEKKGVNFIINPHPVEPLGNQNKQELKDPLGSPLPPVAPQQDLSVVLVTINQPLKNLTMREMLNAITNVTANVGKHGLAYQVEDYAVVFRERVIEPPQLFTRIFKIDGDTFIQGLEKVTGQKVLPLSTNLVVSGGTNLLWKPVTTNNATVRTEQIQSITRKFFKEQGVNMETNAQGGAATQIFLNDRTGVLMVRASLTDLEIIREWVEKFTAMEGKQLEVNETKEQWINRNQDTLSKEKAPLGLAPPPRDQQMKKQDDERITKVFKVDPDSTVNGFREMMKKSGFASTNLQEMMREFIYRAGVKLSDNNTNGSVLFLNERTGVLLARAKPQEMQIIESAIEVLNIIPPQVQIEAQYIEVPEKVAEEMGLKWFANGLPPDVSKPVAAVQLALASSSSKRFGIHMDAPQVPNHVSILSPEQARELLKRLDNAEGVDRLSAPRVTTVNKRQAQISVMEAMTVVVGRTNRVVKGEAGKKDSEEPVFITEQLAMGPVLDVIPNVYPDGKSMRLDWVFSLTEFLGYEKPEKKGELPEPQVRQRLVSNQNVIQDGYTLVAGCGMADVKSEGKKGLFNSGRSKTEKKMVLILMRVSLIDPAGNLVNPGK